MRTNPLYIHWRCRDCGKIHALELKRPSKLKICSMDKEREECSRRMPDQTERDRLRGYAGTCTVYAEEPEMRIENAIEAIPF